MSAKKKTSLITTNDLVAVIDIGSTSIRMAIAEFREGKAFPLESLQQSISLGKDVFYHNSILPETTESCVKALNSFRKLLDEYNISEKKLRAVATNAVRDANNTESFVDRILIATGFNVEVIDETEVNRVAYLGISSQLKESEKLSSHSLLVLEIGGGSTEVIGLEKGKVKFSSTFRLGTLRLYEQLEEKNVSSSKVSEFLKQQIDSQLMQLNQNIPNLTKPQLLLLGGEARFSAEILIPDWDRKSLVRLRVKQLQVLTEKILSSTVDDLINTYQLSYPEAETLGPCLVAYLRLAKDFGLKSVWVSNVTMRDGLIIEMAREKSWTKDFTDQIIHSAIEFGKKFNFDKKHSIQVADLSKKLFNELKDEHNLPPLYETILYISGILHDIGTFINSRSHHKHSMYLILNSDLFGLGEKYTYFVALISRYHRRAVPKMTHSEFTKLNRRDRILIMKLAAILRVADSLDRSHLGCIKDLKCTVTEDTFLIDVDTPLDLTLEKIALQDKADLFREVYGKSVILREKRS